MSITFNDSNLQQVFLKKGYVVIPAILNRSDLAKLTSIFLQFETHISQPFHTSHFSADLEYKRTIQNAIFDIVFPKTKQYLHEYIPVFANLMVKNPNADNSLQMHADWAYIDESKHRSISVWIPFVDTNKHNGCFGVIDGSHQFMNSLRGPGIQQNNFRRDKIWVKKYGKLLPLNAGDAIFFDHALLHFSPANKTKKIRPAINLSLTPTGVELLHYCIPNDTDKIEKYIVKNIDFFLEYENFKRPKIGTPVEYLSKDTVHFIDDLVENYGKTHLSNWQQFISSLKEVF